MNRFLREFAQRQWAMDIERYDRMKRIARDTISPECKAIAERNMAEIQAKYPGKIKDPQP